MAVINTVTFESNYMTTRNFEDAFHFVRAITFANSWLKYKDLCAKNKVAPNRKILEWIPDAVSDEYSLMPLEPEDVNSNSVHSEAEFKCLM